MSLNSTCATRDPGPRKKRKEKKDAHNMNAVTFYHSEITILEFECVILMRELSMYCGLMSQV